MAFYRCPYILRSEEVCNRSCYQEKEYLIHWNLPPRSPCKECGKLTYSKYGTCDIHAKKYQKMAQYHQKKMTNITPTIEVKMGNTGDTTFLTRYGMRNAKCGMLPVQVCPSIYSGARQEIFYCEDELYRSEVVMSQDEWNLRQIYQTLVDLFHPHHENLSRIQSILSWGFSISSKFWLKPPAEITRSYPWETGFLVSDKNPDKADNQLESNQSGGQPRLGSKQIHKQAYSRAHTKEPDKAENKRESKRSRQNEGNEKSIQKPLTQPEGSGNQTKWR
ncbi:hypothetical protein GLOIN_2v1485311 [Rhizophagus irregularis DAOM 181602=DAOM 197198]|nr:hypothetical protein GLOIN_2v1485311 [Rhizophagus irregularis DAOM 181602=DAOM 197198]